MDVSDRLVQQHRRRLSILVLLVVILTAVAATTPVHRVILSVIDSVQPVIQEHAFAGAVLFVLLSAISAVVFFFSTALITPLAVDAWGPLTTLLLLWLGWVLGGMTTYAIGRQCGRHVVTWFIDPQRVRDYESQARRLVSFRHVFLFQIALPSEIPGYVLGLVGCRFRTFVLAMALAELPFALGAVYLGVSFLERNYLLLFAIGGAGIALSWFMFQRLRQASAEARHTGT